MSTQQWEDVEIPQGTFIGWGEIGQTVTGTVISFAAEGATDFNDNPCPQLVIELTEQAITFKDKGTTRDSIPAGEFATITAGQANLKRNLLAAALTPGDTVRIKFEGTYKTGKGEGKSFKVQVARGQAPVARPAEDGDLL